MRFLSLTIKGAIPFPNETRIDFPAAKKVALTGENGAGKSTVLDCIYAALYGDTTKPNGLYSLFAGRKDGLIDLTFEIKGHQYQVRRLIDGVGRKQKPYLYMDGQPITEGKVAEFNQAVADAVGLNERAFLATTYNSQTLKGNPLALDDKGRRDLLSDVLGLGQFDEPYDRVTATLKDVEREREALDRQREVLAHTMPPVDSLTLERADKEITLSGVTHRIRQADEAIETARQAYHNAKANAQQVDEVKRQIGVLSQQVASDEAEKAGLESKVRANQSDLLDRRGDILAAVRESDVLSDDLAALESDRADVLAEADRLDAAHRTDLAEESQTLAAYRTSLESLKKSNLTIHRQRQAIEGDIRALDLTIGTNEAQARTLDLVPCQGTDFNNRCPLLESAQCAAQQIPEKQRQRDAMVAQLACLTTEDEAEKTLAAEVTAMDTAIHTKQLVQSSKAQRDSAREIDLRLKEIRNRLEVIAPLVKNAPFLKDAEERIAGYQQAIAVIDLRLDSNRQALAQWQQKLADANALTETLDRLVKEVAQAEASRQTLQAERDTMMQRIAAIDAQLQQAEAIKAQADKILADRNVLSEGLSILGLLKEALGPKGARALLIDAAGPAISELVNALLRECYGSRFTIAIKTLRELTSQAGEFREALEFSIIDNETGEETPVENKSGGEQQIIKEVVSLGLCIYQRRKAGIDTRTIIRDESCSALSEDNTVRYVRMLDKAAEIGEFDQILYVSHKSCAQAMADSVIAIAGGKATVTAA